MRQHSVPVILGSGPGGAIPLRPLDESGGQVSEADIQALIHAHPGCLPIAEIDPMFVGPVPICMELSTPAGSIDNLMVTPSGLPVLVECKLWRNPEGRREVVGQILDYAKELGRWSSSDLQREVKRRLGGEGKSLLDLVREADPSVDEIQFNDALTHNLRRGRFLLLIVGDGIREGVEAIAEYLQAHAGLHFSLGLVELPIYVMPDGSRLVVPRVLARTANLVRNVVATPDGYSIETTEAEGGEIGASRTELYEERLRFWAEFLADLALDDPEQPIPRPSKQGYLYFMLPAPSGGAWMDVFRDIRRGQVGIAFVASRKGVGDYAMRTVLDDWETVRAELGGAATLKSGDGGQWISRSWKQGPSMTQK